MSVLNEMIKAARGSNPASFKKLFESEIESRILAEVETMKIDVIAEMFNVAESEECDEDEDEDDEDSKGKLDENVVKRTVQLAGRTARGTVKDSLRTASRKIGVGVGALAGGAASHALGGSISGGMAAGGAVGAMGVQAAREALARRRERAAANK